MAPERVLEEREAPVADPLLREDDGRLLELPEDRVADPLLREDGERLVADPLLRVEDDERPVAELRVVLRVEVERDVAELRVVERVEVAELRPLLERTVVRAPDEVRSPLREERVEPAVVPVEPVRDVERPTRRLELFPSSAERPTVRRSLAALLEEVALVLRLLSARMPPRPVVRPRGW